MVGRLGRGFLDDLVRDAGIAGRRVLSAIGEYAEARHDDDEQSECAKRRSRGTDARDSVHDVLNNVGSLPVFKRRAKVNFLTTV